MPELQLLRADHAAALRRFEVDNRAWFAQWISDRGDAFFEHFADQFGQRLAEQDDGEAAYYVLVEPDGSVVGRANLYFAGDADANLGYRVARTVGGRGVATAAVRALCDLALRQHGRRRLLAAVSHPNVASQRVLEKAGFVRTGPADPADVGGRPGYRYERLLDGGA